MTFLFPEMQQDELSTHSDSTSTAQTWCDPSQYNEVIGIDFGCNSVHYYMARCNRKGKMAFSQLSSWLLQLPSETLLLCESAHLGVPQTQNSLAQPFTRDELLDLYQQLRSRGVTLKLAPHAHTGRRMRRWVAHNFPELMRNAEKTDAADALALAIYVDRCNEISLANPYTSFDRSPLRDFGREITRRSNNVLNAERTVEYGGDFHPLIMKLARKVMRRGGFPSLKFVVSVASTLFCEDEDKLLEFTHCGQRPGKWSWMRHIVRMTPWHQRGGVARSNHMWHTFRPHFQKRAKRLGLRVKSGNAYKQFALHSSDEKAARTVAMKSYRTMLLRARELCIREAARMGAGRMELTEVSQEVTHGR
jgi:hypothetical protein